MKTTCMKAAIPWSLVLLRFLLAPALLLLLGLGALTDGLLLAIYVVAFASDYADGVIARWLGVATPLLRAADSAADTVFHLAVFGATFALHRDEFLSPVVPAFLG